tara:strand:+ start:339 stop:803 length:465 start_codon:yes stop_codon:yes gene_type:complete
MSISMLDGEEKTKIINGMSKSIEDLVGSKEYGGWLVVLIHNVTVIVVLIQIFCRNSKIEVGLGTTVWLFMVFCHFVFNGCILVRLERNLFESKEWYNVWYLLFYFAELIGYPLSHSNFLIIQNTLGILVTVLVIWRAYTVFTRNEKIEDNEKKA